MTEEETRRRRRNSLNTTDRLVFSGHVLTLHTAVNRRCPLLLGGISPTGGGEVGRDKASTEQTGVHGCSGSTSLPSWRPEAAGSTPTQQSSGVGEQGPSWRQELTFDIQEQTQEKGSGFKSG